MFCEILSFLILCFLGFCAFNWTIIGIIRFVASICEDSKKPLTWAETQTLHQAQNLTGVYVNEPYKELSPWGMQLREWQALRQAESLTRIKVCE